MSKADSNEPRRAWLRYLWKVVILVALALLVYVTLDHGDAERSEPRVLEPQDVERFYDNDELGRTGPVTAPGLEILVNLEDSRDELEEELEQDLGIDLVLNSEHADDENQFVARVQPARLDDLLEKLSSVEGVEHAEVNGTMEVFGTSPNDPLYMFQWHFEQVNAEEAWELSTGDGAVVAVIDTGVAFEDAAGSKRGILVPDLKGTRLVEGYDFVDNDRHPYDQHGHGTHVAGTVAQSTNNEYGVAGLAHDAEVMPLRVLDARGVGSFADVADAIRFAADHNADVINLSLGAFVPSREVDSAVRYAHEAGVVVVAAAGNSGSRVPSYPAAFDHVIAVAATQYDRTATFYSNYGNYIDIAAPGGNTLVDQNDDGKPDGVMQETLKRTPDGQIVFEPVFALYMGTSMAAPHVAAAAALLVESGVSNPDAVERILAESAADEGEEGWDEHYGHGILDVSAALRGHHLRSGFYRVIVALLLTLLALWRLRRKDMMASGDRPGGFFWMGWGIGAGALFFIPLLIGSTGVIGSILALPTSPVMRWGSVLLGPGGENPLFASALPVLVSAGLLLGVRGGRHLTAGLGLSMGSVLLVEAARHMSDVLWIPGVGLLDQAWLVANGVFALLLGTVALRRS